MLTWLHDSKNAVHKDDRVMVIGAFCAIVYAEIKISYIISLLKKNSIIIKYPNFIKHLNTHWKKWCLWAHCYRIDILLRGNHTDNYAEAGIQILKELLFSSVSNFKPQI